MSQKKCDWIGCSEIGFFDGLDKKPLTDQAKKHISPALSFLTEKYPGSQIFHTYKLQDPKIVFDSTDSDALSTLN